jgi:hypothetical protein
MLTCYIIFPNDVNTIVRRIYGNNSPINEKKFSVFTRFKIFIKIRTSKEQGRIDKPEAPVTLGTGRRSKTNKTRL